MGLANVPRKKWVKLLPLEVKGTKLHFLISCPYIINLEILIGKKPDIDFAIVSLKRAIVGIVSITSLTGALISCP